MSELGGMTDSPIFGDNIGSLRASVSALLSPYRPEVQAEVLQSVNQTLSLSDKFQVLAGPVLRDRPILVSVSRRVTLLVAAAVGLLIYFVFLKLRPLSLMTAMAVVSAVAAAFVAVIPGPGQILLIRLIPGCVIAVLAAILQRAFGHRHETTSLALADYDQSTVFTVERPLVTSGSRSGTDSPATVISATSQLSVP